MKGRIGCSPHISVREKSLLECVVIDESFSIELNLSLWVNATAEEFVVIYQKWTIVSNLRYLTALRSRRTEIAPVVSKLNAEVEKDKAHKENLERCPWLVAKELVLAVPFSCHLRLLIHMLGNLEIKECHLIVGKVACQLYIHSLATVSDWPFRVMILLCAKYTDSLNEVLSLQSWFECEALLKVG